MSDNVKPLTREEVDALIVEYVEAWEQPIARRRRLDLDRVKARLFMEPQPTRIARLFATARARAQSGGPLLVALKEIAKISARSPGGPKAIMRINFLAYNAVLAAEESTTPAPTPTGRASGDKP